MSSITLCRCCNQPMEAVEQSEQIQTNRAGNTRVIPAYTIVTCWNKGCAMHAFTFEARHYQIVDLNKYMETGRG